MLKLKTQFASLTNCETKPVNWSKNISKHFHSIRQYGTLLHCYKRRKIRKTIPYCTLFGPFFSSNFSVWKGNQSSKRTFFFYRCFNFVLFSSNLFVFYLYCIRWSPDFFFNLWFFETFFTFMVATKTYLLSLLWVKLNCVIPHNPQVFELSRTHLSSPEGSKILYLRFAGVFVVWTYSLTFDYTEK